MGICICITDSLCCAPGTNATWSINYTWIFKKSKKKKTKLATEENVDAPRWLSIWESTEEGTSYYFRPKRAALIWGFVGSEFSRSQAWIISSCEVAWELPSEVSTGMHSRAKERELPKFFEAEGSVFYDPGKEGHSECGEWCWAGGSGGWEVECEEGGAGLLTLFASLVVLLGHNTNCTQIRISFFFF